MSECQSCCQPEALDGYLARMEDGTRPVPTTARSEPEPAAMVVEEASKETVPVAEVSEGVQQTVPVVEVSEADPAEPKPAAQMGGDTPTPQTPTELEETPPEPAAVNVHDSVSLQATFTDTVPTDTALEEAAVFEQDREPDHPGAELGSHVQVWPPSPKPDESDEVVQVPVVEIQTAEVTPHVQPNGGKSQEGDGIIPDINDMSAPRPRLGEHTLSANAIKCRAKRIFTRRVDGRAKVSETIFAEWHAMGPERKTLEQIFKQCGYDPEAWLQLLLVGDVGSGDIHLRGGDH